MDSVARSLPLMSLPMYSWNKSPGPEETKNLAGNALRLIQIRLAKAEFAKKSRLLVKHKPGAKNRFLDELSTRCLRTKKC